MTPVPRPASDRSAGSRPISFLRFVAVLAALAGFLISCGHVRDRAAPAWHESIPTASCAPEPNLARAPMPGESGVYRAGPVTLVTGNDVAQHPEEWVGRRTSGSDAIVALTGRRLALLSVDRASRGRFSLQFTPYGRGHPSPVLADGRFAVRFPACPGRRHRFGGGVLFKGTGCALLHVGQLGRSAIPLLIPIGNTLRDCPAASSTGTFAMPTLPFLGVSCPVGNSIVCDRVGRRAA
jgi:hypothetical protein